MILADIIKDSPTRVKGTGVVAIIEGYLFARKLPGFDVTNWRRLF